MKSIMGEQKPRKFFYGWVVFALCFMMIFCVLGFCSSAKSLFLAPITEDLGISRSLFSIADSVRYVTTAVVNIFFGFLIVRWRPRKMVAFGFVALIAFALITSFAKNLAGFYLGGFFLGIGLSWTTTSLVGYVVEKWFTKSKGTIMGFILAANGLGAALASQIFSPILNSRSDGWRLAYRVSAIVVASCGVLVVLFLRNTPEELGLEPLGRDKVAKAKRGNSWKGISLKEASKKSYFYLAAACVFLTGLILQSSGGISSAHMKDCGIDPAFIATCLSIHSVTLACAKLFTGFFFDKSGLSSTMLFCGVCTVIATAVLALVSNNSMAMIYSILESFAAPLETIMIPLIVLDLFGSESYAKILGLFISFNTAGYALGAPLVNSIFDLTGSYKSILLILSALSALVMVLMQFCIAKAHKLAKDLEKEEQ